MILTERIQLWVIGGTGYTQGWDEPTGLELVWRELRGYSSPRVCVALPLTWDGEAEGLATIIARNSAPGAKVVFYGHSYGVGEFFRKFARALQAHGIVVSVAIFADGIRRFKAAKFFSSKWFRPMVQIKVPGNVYRVEAFHQRNDALLCGHEVVAENPQATEVMMREQFDCKHSDSDNDPNFRRVVVTEVEHAIRAL